MTNGDTFLSVCVRDEKNRESAKKVDDEEEEEESTKKWKTRMNQSTHKKPHANRLESKTFIMGQKVYHFITQCGTIDTHTHALNINIFAAAAAAAAATLQAIHLCAIRLIYMAINY